ncbi:MAG: hypothetical protein WCG87_00505 [Bacteroidota bacterium]
MKNVCQTLLFVITFVSLACTDKRSNIDDKKLCGVWMTNCNSGLGIITIPESLDTTLMEINSNQIYIDSKIDILHTKDRTSLLFRLITPDDLGAGGARLHWDDFSRDSIIAIMNIIDTKHADLKWFGFYDTKLKKRVWLHDYELLDFDSTINHVLITKCKG